MHPCVESRASSSTDSSDSSPSDLRRRLEDLPSPNEFIFLADRVAAHGRRICRKREVFLRLHGVANRIEENDEWEEREQKAGLESFLEASRPKDARARRRARARLESSPCRDDKAMVISQAASSTGPFKIIVNDDKLNPTESSMDRSARDDRLRLPAIAIPRGQSRSSSLSEPSSTRFSHHSNGESLDTRSKTASHSYRNFTPRDRASKSADLPSVSPFSLSGVQPKKFGGYRPSPGVIMKNLSSGSESECANGASRGFSSVRKIGNTIATLELSSPESRAVSSVNGPIKKMPIMSARTDITGSILPNLLPSSRSLDNDDLNHRIAENTSRSYIGQVNRDGTKTCNERTSHDGFVAKTSSELRQAEPEYEDTRYQQQETPQATSTFFARSFMPRSAELVTSTYNEQVIHNEPATKAYNEFKLVGSEFDDKREEVEDYQHITSKIHHDDIQNQFEFNCPTGRSNFEATSLENNGNVLDVAEWNRSTSLYTKDAVDTSHFIEAIQNDDAEDALSSQTSEPYGSEDHSRSSCTAKIYSQKETFSSRRPQNGIDTSDKCDREIITKVPTLALNSQDISYSTSAGSRECSATRPLDPHALIKALSDVSLRQEKHQGGDVSRKREGFYRAKDTIDVSSRASDFPTKGETWRVPRFSTSESPEKSLSRVSSKIPVRISSSKIISPGNKLSGCYIPENSSETANYAESKFIERNNVPCVTNLSCSQICKRDSSLKSLRSKGIEVAIAGGAFAPDDKTAEFEINDRAPGSLTSSNLRNSQSTPFGDYSRDKMQRLSGSKFQGESCPPVFFRKAAYPSSQDYARIDDDVRSRSDRSTSRKSVDTMDVTSVTESPGLSKYKKTESSQIESLRNVEENVTWRTEDECASINDEENLEDTKDKDYVSRDKMPEGPYLQENEHYELRRYDSSPLRTQQFDSSSEIQKGGRKRRAGDDGEFNDDKISFDQNLEITKIAQSENLTFQVRRTQELSSFAARISSSMLNLNYEPKRKKKKSQERFPFTISEASGALSAKHENASDYKSPDENFGRTKMDDQLREKTVYQLKTHPSVTRLATSGMEDTVTDILCCVAQEKKENAMSSKSKLKAFIRIFSKLRKAPKRPNDKTPESAKIIYENNACRADSKANSCSGDSSTEEARKTYSDDRWIDHHAARSKPTLVSSWETSKKTESFQAIAQEHLPRRYDRDDLWVQDIKNSSFEKKDGEETQQRKDEANGSEESPPKDRYSIFLAKNLQSNHDNYLKEKHDVPISDHVISPDGKDKRSIDRKVPSNFISEVEEIEEELTDCLCWRLWHIIAPFKYRSSIKEQASRTKRSNSLLQKRKK
ncbi:Uncharacterized protein DBV15_00496 [Temnothorax longispinosus]|uniref:Uncharacterized protein n=1 Tax=Temnothorax longispinosus TaxID=300112 RepID=A0A4S2JPZ7_9HYME|nr:Uncharacterized protein DBV15_00496 [Temnothorax longispinosus]